MIRKKIAILVPAFLCAALFFSLPALCFAQAMNGTYTVKTSGGDYASIQAAAVDLSAFGVSGPVVIEVYGNPITYSGLVTINAIAGSSAVNTVTFREFAGEDVTVSNSSGNNIFYLNDPDYVTIDGFTIQNCTQDGIRITNTSKSVTIKNCTISNAGTSGNYSAIYAD
ncbi:MAG: hypothetical protein HZA48_03635, partial [Planctomycetes bacterium]|nr:hypothetical protein [Planctomycetota bacterium]